MLGGISDKRFLWLIRGVVTLFGIFVMLFAMRSIESNATIFEMVENAYKVTLAGTFVPLFFGLYWKRAMTQGAVLSMILGIGVWLVQESINPAGIYPPQLAGFVAALIGMLAGLMAPQFLRHDPEKQHPSQEL